MSETITVCCVCHAALIDGRWVDGPEADAACEGHELSHGYCTECYIKAIADIEREAAR